MIILGRKLTMDESVEFEHRIRRCRAGKAWFVGKTDRLVKGLHNMQ